MDKAGARVTQGRPPGRASTLRTRSRRRSGFATKISEGDGQGQGAPHRKLGHRESCPDLPVTLAVGPGLFPGPRPTTELPSGGDHHGGPAALTQATPRHVRTRVRPTEQRQEEEGRVEIEVRFTQQRGAVHSVGVWGRKGDSQPAGPTLAPLLRPAGGTAARPRRRGAGRPTRAPWSGGLVRALSSPPPGATCDAPEPARHAGSTAWPPLSLRLPSSAACHPLRRAEAPHECKYKCP